MHYKDGAGYCACATRLLFYNCLLKDPGGVANVSMGLCTSALLRCESTNIPQRSTHLSSPRQAKTNYEMTCSTAAREVSSAREDMQQKDFASRSTTAGKRVWKVGAAPRSILKLCLAPWFDTPARAGHTVPK